MVTHKKSRAAGPTKKINLALQGGGAHGAFAWGVLDRLLEDGRLTIDGICATSAGTMNACALAHGLEKGGGHTPQGRQCARQSLHDFWEAVSAAGNLFNPVKPLPWETPGLTGVDYSSSFWVFDTVVRMFSPYQLNPLGLNPLRDVLEDMIDFDLLQKCRCLKLFISATNVRSGKVTVFENDALTLDAAMASACLPYLFKAVEIEGEAYWDGGYMGNPALFPLFYKTNTRDILVVHINPIERDDVPATAQAIMNRVNEISFNGSLLKEIRAIAFVKKLIENDMLKDEYTDQFTDILMHSIRADDLLKPYSVASKFDSSWDFLIMLRDLGRSAMSDWLLKNFDAVNNHDTVDLHEDFLETVSRLFSKRASS